MIEVYESQEGFSETSLRLRRRKWDDIKGIEKSVTKAFYEISM